MTNHSYKSDLCVALVTYFIDHATYCKSNECICKGSTFRDALVGIKKADSELAQVIDKVLAR